MVEYTPAEQCLRRLIMARNLLANLSSLRLGDGCPPMFVFQYGTMHLVQFMDAYEGLMGCLTDEQKGPVLCLSDLISGMVEHKSVLREVRNKWIAHLQDDDGFVEDAPDFVWRTGLPDDPVWYLETFECAVIFADAVQSLLPEVASPVLERVDQALGDEHMEYSLDPARLARNVQARLEKARKKAEEAHPDRPWAALLGIAGTGPERLGGDIS